MSSYTTGVREAVDNYLVAEAMKVRDYGDYWSASSAGYCMRRLIFERLGLPPTKEDARKQRVFTAGHIFHDWMQGITKAAGLSVASEVELQDEGIMVRGHFDDLILVNDNLILYDYKTANSRSFTYSKGRPISHFHKMQLGTYAYMLRKTDMRSTGDRPWDSKDLTDLRALKISKDDLRMEEKLVTYDAQLEQEVYEYWATLNGYWNKRQVPKCTCADFENGFLAKEAYNPFFFNGEPCSIEYYKKWKAEQS